ncbi:hypothetical protein JTB14_014247 [Gonioctena quinquepunctata]|nr:hypothetical protein JTB14_014247 [Gonioctena quinquepunctata]
MEKAPHDAVISTGDDSLGVGNPPRRRPQCSQDIYHTTTTQRGPDGPTRTRRKSPGQGPPRLGKSLWRYESLHVGNPPRRRPQDHQGIIHPLGDDTLG